MDPVTAAIEIVPLRDDLLVDATELLEAQLVEHELPLPARGVRFVLSELLRQPALGLVLLARRAGASVGVAYLSTQWTLERGGANCWLEELYVLPALRGQGIGSQLLRAALAELTARGCESMDLEVEAGHERAARLYERLGFRRLPRTRYWRRLRSG
jgi:ribosomal protein S18 acetylase RimI-like enzyme